jgi:hypothetical protein
MNELSRGYSHPRKAGNPKRQRRTCPVYCRFREWFAFFAAL